MSNKEILEAIIADQGLNYASLSRALGINGNPSLLYNIRDGVVKSISPKMIDKILEAFPQYNRFWLQTGQGERNKEQSQLIDVGTLRDRIKELEAINETLKGQIVIRDSKIRELEKEILILKS